MADDHTTLLIAAIKEFRAKARSAFELAKVAHASSTQSAAQKVAAAKEFIAETRTFRSALEMYQSTAMYPFLCTHDDWAEWNVIGVTNVKTWDEGLSGTSAFTWGKHDWAFALNDDGHFDKRKYGALTVEYNGQAVMELRLVTDNPEYDDWRLVDVRALVVGPWVAVLTEMAMRMELAEENRQLSDEAKQLRSKAARIRL